MATNPRISLVFVSYHSAWELSLALQKLFALEPDRELFEVIVVNNDTREQIVLRKLAQRLPFRLFEMPENGGFGKGANFGAREARGDILGFLNPDIVWQKENLRELDATFLEYKTSQILGLQLLDSQGKYSRWDGGRAPSFFELLKHNLLPFLLRTQDADDATLDWVSGCGLFLRKRFFYSLGGFDERFFLYFEDVDLCLRAKAQGAVIVSPPRFTVIHQGGKSFSSLGEQKKYFYASQIHYFQKHRGVAETFFVRLLHKFLHGL